MFISATSVQAEPFQVSVTFELPFTAIAAVVVPQPATEYLAVFKFAPSVQDDPSHVSALTVVGGTCPPNAKAAVAEPDDEDPN